MSDTIPGASVFEQRLYDHVIAHIEGEREALREYQRVAERSGSTAFAFLTKLILEDERRHHLMLDDLAHTIRTSAEMSPEAPPVPDLDLHKDREAILEATEVLLAIEKQDDRELAALTKELRDFKDTTLWALMLQIMRSDNAKHRAILGFVRSHARKHTV
jgi:hypothetical protein